MPAIKRALPVADPGSQGASDGKRVEFTRSCAWRFEKTDPEMGAVHLRVQAGIPPAVIRNQTSHIAGRLRKRRYDRKLVVRAAE